jgi:hypothetical protein
MSSMKHWDREDGVYYRRGWRIEPWTCDSRRRYTVYCGTTELAEFPTRRAAVEYAEAEIKRSHVESARRVAAELARWL